MVEINFVVFTVWFVATLFAVVVGAIRLFFFLKKPVDPWKVMIEPDEYKVGFEYRIAKWDPEEKRYYQKLKKTVPSAAQAHIEARRWIDGNIEFTYTPDHNISEEEDDD